MYWTWCIVMLIKDELVSLLPHKWVEPVTIPLVNYGIDLESLK